MKKKQPKPKTWTVWAILSKRGAFVCTAPTKWEALYSLNEGERAVKMTLTEAK